MKQIDARGRSCPEPVLMTKKGLTESPEGVIVLVDNTTALENIKRFAGNQKYTVAVEEQGEDYQLTIKK
jgi:tRNA 2-thiouridine synthesizing protein A